LIVLKLPVNFNLGFFKEEIKSDFVITVTSTRIRKTLTLVLRVLQGDKYNREHSKRQRGDYE
jgi:hypothetical protein